MEISGFVIRIMSMAIPGIIASRIYRALQGESKGKDWESFIEIALFSVASYALYGLGALAVEEPVRSFNALLYEELPLSWWEISVASIVSLPLAYIASLLSRKKLINKFGQVLNVTERFGGESAWPLLLELPEVQEWVYVRDHKIGLTYFGYVMAYSGHEQKELIMRDVEVYISESGDFLYKRNIIYIARSQNDLTIEVPDIPPDNVAIESKKG